MRQVIKAAVGRPQRLTPLPIGIQHDADAGCEVPPVVPRNRLPWHRVVAGEHEAGRGIREGRAAEPLIESLTIEACKPSLRAVDGQVGIPPQAGVDRDVRREPPAVLRVDADVVVAHVHAGERSGRERRRATEKEIGKTEIRHLPGERRIARRGEVRGRVVLVVNVGAAESQLVPPRTTVRSLATW